MLQGIKKIIPDFHNSAEKRAHFVEERSVSIFTQDNALVGRDEDYLKIHISLSIRRRPIIPEALITVIVIPLISGAKLPAKLLELLLIGFPFKAQSLGQCKIHLIMIGYITHVPSLGEQSVGFTKIGISDNF